MMRDSIFLLLSFCFITQLMGMEPQQERGAKGASARLAASAGNYAQAARQLREQMKRERESGFLSNVENFFKNLVSSKPSKQEKHTEEAEIQAEIKQMNDIFVRWKQKPEDPSLRDELVAIQTQLISRHAILLQADKPQLSLKIGDAVAKVSQERDEILKQKGQLKPEKSKATIKQGTVITETGIARALLQLHEQRQKNSKPYVWGARIGLAGIFAGLGLGAFGCIKPSHTLAAFGCFSSVLGYSVYKHANMPLPTKDDAIRLLQQQK